MGADRLDRQVQGVGDVGQPLTGNDTLQDVEFPVRQFGVAGCFRQAAHLLHDALGQTRWQINAALQNLLQGGEQAVRCAFLGDVAGRAGLERAYRVLFLGVHAQHQHRDLDVFDVHAPDQVQTRHPGQREIDDGDRERLQPQALQRLTGIAGFADRPPPGNGLENSLDALAHDRVVVDQQKAARS